jgi:putative NIF3 family GTP cyclohydrolase 1 type 2
MKKHMDGMSKNGLFFEKKSSVYAGLMLGAIYSTLPENDIEIYQCHNKKNP